MEVTSTKAALVENGDVGAESRLTVTLPRFEVEAALKEADQPELILDVLRGTGEDSDAERHQISVAWDPADIEQLLKQTPGDAITFGFERDELEKLIDSDVEAHGLKEKALVLSVAVGIAGAGATQALAGYDELGPGARGIATVASHDEMTSAQRGIETPAPAQRDEMTAAQRGIEATPAASHDELTASQRGIEATPAASHDELTAAQRGIEATPTRSHDEMTAAQRGIEPQVAASHDEATLAQRGIEPTVAAAHDEMTLAQRGIPDNVVAAHDELSAADRGIQPTSTPVGVSADDGPVLDASTAATLGLVGGMGLLILGAAFVSRRRAPHPA
jgi:hypothetical protein